MTAPKPEAPVSTPLAFAAGSIWLHAPQTRLEHVQSQTISALMESSRAMLVRDIDRSLRVHAAMAGDVVWRPRPFPDDGD
jgi:hypothetical protein